MMFDQILDAVSEIIGEHQEEIQLLEWFVVNRDLNGRVRFIVPQFIERRTEMLPFIETMYRKLAEQIGPHAYPPTSGIMFEDNLDAILNGTENYLLKGFCNVWIVDRLVKENNWSNITKESKGIPRAVFFSINGGVGRSTALAVTARKMAQQGKRVLVLDLDLESPGLSFSFLPQKQRPTYGIVDWLVEDLVDNGDAVFEKMVSTNVSSWGGEIYIVPAHGAKPGEYITKLGRVMMPKVSSGGVYELWYARLQRLLHDLEVSIQPDVILIDSPSGFSETASCCITSLGANLILLFAKDDVQTWNGYRIMLNHWLQTGAIRNIRERLQVVAAMVPELNPVEYLTSLRENAYDLFLETTYDVVSAGEIGEWSFDIGNEDAPHQPLKVRWYGVLSTSKSIYEKMTEISDDEIRYAFGPLVGKVNFCLG